MAVGQQGALFALNDAVIAIAFLLAPGSWIAIACRWAIWRSTIGRVPGCKLTFNSAQQFFTTAAGVLVMSRCGGGVPGAVAGLAAFALLNYVIIGSPDRDHVPGVLLRVLLAMAPARARPQRR